MRVLVVSRACWTVASYVWVSLLFFFFKQKTAYEMRIRDWSSDVCSSDPGCTTPRRARPWFWIRRMAKRSHRNRPDERDRRRRVVQNGKASGREKVCQYV